MKKRKASEPLSEPRAGGESMTKVSASPNGLVQLKKNEREPFGRTVTGEVGGQLGGAGVTTSRKRVVGADSPPWPSVAL